MLRRAFAAGDVALQGVAFQRLYEFRLDDATVVGLGGEASRTVSDRGRVFVAGMFYRQHGGRAIADWNQQRVSLRFEWAVGSEPGSPSGSPR
jgi:hypothetical protein